MGGPIIECRRPDLCREFGAAIDPRACRKSGSLCDGAWNGARRRAAGEEAQLFCWRAASGHLESSQSGQSGKRAPSSSAKAVPEERRNADGPLAAFGATKVDRKMSNSEALPPSEESALQSARRHSHSQALGPTVWARLLPLN